MLNMKMRPVILAAAALCVVIAACKKNHPNPVKTTPVRKVRYELFTYLDFSGAKANITFTLHMGDHLHPIFDSVLPTMRVEQIPDSLHRIIIERTVPGNDTLPLSVGFLYTIENVGSSWFLDSFPAHDTLKVIRYPFQ
jgi:hypothetical protein